MEPRKNYQKELEQILDGLGGARPRLLLHSCCGPCSSYVLVYLMDYFDITVYYYNPCIAPAEEYEHRRRSRPAEELRLSAGSENRSPE